MDGVLGVGGEAREVEVEVSSAILFSRGEINTEKKEETRRNERNNGLLPYVMGSQGDVSSDVCASGSSKSLHHTNSIHVAGSRGRGGNGDGGRVVLDANNSGQDDVAFLETASCP